MSKTALSDAIKACRGNQAHLARLLGVSRSSIAKWKTRGVPRWWRDAVLEMAKSYRELGAIERKHPQAGSK